MLENCRNPRKWDEIHDWWVTTKCLFKFQLKLSTAVLSLNQCKGTFKQKCEFKFTGQPCNKAIKFYILFIQLFFNVSIIYLYDIVYTAGSLLLEESKNRQLLGKWVVRVHNKGMEKQCFDTQQASGSTFSLPNVVNPSLKKLTRFCFFFLVSFSPTKLSNTTCGKVPMSHAVKLERWTGTNTLFPGQFSSSSLCLVSLQV